MFKCLFFLPNRHVGKSRAPQRRRSVRRARREAFRTHLTPISAVRTPRAGASDVPWRYLARPTVIPSVGTVFLGNHVTMENTTQPVTQTTSHVGSASTHSLSSSFLCFFFVFVFVPPRICRFHSAATQEFSAQSACKKSEHRVAQRRLAYLSSVRSPLLSSRSISEEADSHRG